ncbi:MAG: hypothetical protein C0469_13070 [Cyanobacteria bacterium DS2.3.42]|nr:hypothetical protein [Cyanobacteria bacterium DS2.3.42]
MEEAIEDTSCYQKNCLERIKCSFTEPLYNQLQPYACEAFSSQEQARRRRRKLHQAPQSTMSGESEAIYCFKSRKKLHDAAAPSPYCRLSASDANLQKTGDKRVIAL